MGPRSYYGVNAVDDTAISFPAFALLKGAALASIGVRDRRALAGRIVRQGGGAEPPVGVAVRRVLDLDHVGAEVGQQRGR